MAVVKSDAYGHGAAGVVQVLIGSGASALGVASVDEGCQLRPFDNLIPILVLSPVPTWAIGTALEHNLDFTVTSAAQVHELAAVARRKQTTARVHLKVDTGMHRLGVAPQFLSVVLDEIKKSNHIQLVSVFSHLAKADDDESVRRQSDQFQKTVQWIKHVEPQLQTRSVQSPTEPIFFHLASGDAARRFPFAHYDMVRVGLLLYGLESRSIPADLMPAMSIRGRINHIRNIDAAESVGYGFTWTSTRPTRLASIPIGYADGVDRGLSNRMKAILMGREISQVGTISMDQMLFDVTDVPEAQEGDVITLIGSDGQCSIQLASWSRMLDTITYELACRMRVRLPRIYTRHRVSRP
jgi:alanine racemase